MRNRISRPRALERALASSGRHGDTELAHVNPREKALLMALGGAGSRNPRTGLREFFGADGAADPFGGGNDPYGGGDPNAGAPGGIGPADPFGGGLDPYGGKDPNAGVPGGVGPADPFAGGDPYGGKDPNAGAPGGIGIGPITPEGFGATPQQGWLERNFGLSNIAKNMDPRTPQGMINALTQMTPFGAAARGAMRGGTQALGGAIEAGLNSMGAYGSAKAEAAPSFGNSDMMGGANDRDYLGGLVGAEPVSDPVSYQTSDPGSVPDEIASFIGPGMSDLQQRALIATHGTQGVNSGFRTDPVKQYYARLLNKALVDGKGGTVSDPYTLPVENLYWQGVLGQNVSNPQNASQVISALSRYL